MADGNAEKPMRETKIMRVVGWRKADKGEQINWKTLMESLNRQE